MQRTITLRSSSQLTDLIFLLFAALIKIVINICEVLFLLGTYFMRKVHEDDISFIEMMLIMSTGIFVSHILSIMGLVF